MAEGLKEILKEIYPLHRTLNSEGTDRALEIVGRHLPEQANYRLLEYEPGKNVWTWTVPERYEVWEAWLKTEDGQKIVDYKDNPLHLVSYSLPVAPLLTWDELKPHLHYSASRPDAIPWVFKYYERDWGFCMSKTQYDSLDREGKYQVYIKADFLSVPTMKAGTAWIQNKGAYTGEMLIMAHICHPNQANDDAAGVVTCIEVIRRLIEKPLPDDSKDIRFLFAPETIGSIAYLHSLDEFDLETIQAGIFVEMTGNDNNLQLQRSRQFDTLIDQIANDVMGYPYPYEFTELIANDERVLNGPGINVPCISISRFPYPEYHTSDDTPDIISEEKLREAADTLEEIIRIYASNYTPMRKYTGPLMLSKYGLWVDWAEDWETNRDIEKMMMSFEGDQSIFEISQGLHMDYWETRAWVEKFREKGLVYAI